MKSMSEDHQRRLRNSEGQIRPSQSFCYLVSGEIPSRDYGNYLAAELNRRRIARRKSARVCPSRRQLLAEALAGPLSL